jgi:hypothetical protein
MAQQPNESQSAIDVLKADNDRLNAQVAKLTSERDKAHGSHEASVKELAELKKQVGDPEAHKARVAELEQKLRTVTHKAEFARLAKAANAHDDAIDDLFTLSGYTPAKDDIDPKALQAIVDDLKQKKAYAFAAQATETEGTRVSESITPGAKVIPGAGRGTSHNPATSGIKLTRAQLMDPKFMLDPKNKELIKAAATGGRLAM